MFKLTRKIEYCLMIIAHMARQRKKDPSVFVNVTKIAKIYGIPQMNTSKAIQHLTRVGFVESRQGIHGGYKLSCQLAKVSLFDLIEIVEGPFGIVKCLHGNDKNSCSYFSNCNIASPMQRLNNKLVSFYKKITLEELIWGILSDSNDFLTNITEKKITKEKNSTNLVH